MILRIFSRWVMITGMLCSLVFSQHTATGVPAETRQGIRIFIAKGNTYFENAVVVIVNDSLVKRGYAVTIVDIKKLAAAKPERYEAMVFLHAVEAGQITPMTREFLNVYPDEDKKANVLICTVRGEKWSDKTSNVSAVTAATKPYKPEPVALKIIIRIDEILSARK